jgi:hypothetical protein
MIRNPTQTARWKEIIIWHVWKFQEGLASGSKYKGLNSVTRARGSVF